jgi:uncharacterized membrane protein YqjE
MNNDSDNLVDKLRRLPQDLRNFVEKRLELFLIETGEKMANMLARLASSLVTLLFTTLGFVFMLVSLALFIGDVIGTAAGGFAIVGVLIFVVALTTHLLAPLLIEEKVREQIGRQLLSDFGPKKTEQGPGQATGGNDAPGRGQTSGRAEGPPVKSEPLSPVDLKQDLNHRL